VKHDGLTDYERGRMDEHRRLLKSWRETFGFEPHPGLSVDENLRELLLRMMVQGFELGANHAKECCWTVDRKYRPGGGPTAVEVGATHKAEAASEIRNLISGLAPLFLVRDYLDHPPLKRGDKEGGAR